MPDAVTDRIILELPKRLTAEVAEYRFDQRLASKSEAYRKLIRLGLAPASPTSAAVLPRST